MIAYKKITLDNGLRVLVHEDDSTPMVAVNVCYNVGSRDELPDKTGFAHLFEHLMFGGTAQVPDFDTPLQNAGGENNAFTNNDITNFYDILPAENLEVALWLESDRMANLLMQQDKLEVQRKVVLEEFSETCLNEPYGDLWHHLAPMAYEQHPYQWPTIGKTPEHIKKAALTDVSQFYQSYYQPHNAVLVIAGNTTVEEAEKLVQRWFAPIVSSAAPIVNEYKAEPFQTTFKSKVVASPTDVDALYMAFHIPSRLDEHFYSADLLSDILGNGPSSRFYSKLLKEQALFSFIDCYISGTIDPGLLIIEAKLNEGISIAQAQAAIWKELEELKNNLLSERELTKVQNKLVSTLRFSEVSVLNKAINLAFFEILGDASLINREAELYKAVNTQQIQQMATKVFQKENCCELIYEVGE